MKGFYLAYLPKNEKDSGRRLAYPVRWDTFEKAEAFRVDEKFTWMHVIESDGFIRDNSGGIDKT